jgi:ubiquinone/menaquinone biosynthesis C-methylase UbiE
MVLPYLRRFPRCRLLDVGCGWEARLLKSAEPYIDSGVGIDFKAPALESAKLRTISVTLDDKLPFDDDSFDVVTLMAVLEHLEKPLQILREIRRVLRKPGQTTGGVDVYSWGGGGGYSGRDGAEQGGEAGFGIFEL